MDLSKTIESSHLWQISLATEEGDAGKRLAQTFRDFREKSAALADEVRRDLPDLTVHDISHLDALWETASIIAGPNTSLTPTEGFVLGGAILLHDLATSVAATPGGLKGILSDLKWKDIVSIRYRQRHNRQPTEDEIASPEPEIYKASLFEYLRQRHAQNAEKLATQRYDDEYLIDNTDVRNSFGRLIGRIAHSHWWSADDLNSQFPQTLGAPHWCPPEWTIDPLKVACILRLADVAHVDARRAPTFLRKISRISEASLEHWSFQERLAKAYVKEDTLVFASGQAFSLEQASAWWLCYDALQYIDKELRAVDSLLADRRSGARLAARRVAGVESPERFASFVETDGWLPINATVHVGDLPRLVATLGGSELYGERPAIALRELVQNARDAVVARRLVESRPTDWGTVVVSLEARGNEHWLTIADTGIGMSRAVLTNFLLNFGTTFWGSTAMQQELPGLAYKGMVPAGKYGIGFFAVFMAGDIVRVTTRRPDAAAKDTLVLEFGQGIQRRPLLRLARDGEELLEGGTTVSMRLKRPPTDPMGLLKEHRYTWSLSDLVTALCPSVDVDVHVRDSAGDIRVICADDWKTLSNSDLLKRVMVCSRAQLVWYLDDDDDVPDDDDQQAIVPFDSPPESEDDNDVTSESLQVVADRREREREWCELAACNLRPIIENGTIVGRALICIGDNAYPHLESRFENGGAVTAGGLWASRLDGVGGLLVGVPSRAARNVAVPIVSAETIKQWAADQVALIPNLYKAPDEQALCAGVARLCGADTGDLPICQFRGRWLSANQVSTDSDVPDRLILLEDHFVRTMLETHGSFEPAPDVVVVKGASSLGLLEDDGGRHPVLWPDPEFFFERGWQELDGEGLTGAVVEALARRWSTTVRKLSRATSFMVRRLHAVGKAAGRKCKANVAVVQRPGVSRSDSDPR